MDNLLKQIRSKYPELENKEERDNKRERNLTTPQKSQSFREKKTTAHWLGRQFSRQMSRGNEFSDEGIEHATAVAAAVFAIRSVEDPEIERPEKNNADRPETSSFLMFKDYKEDIRAPPPRPAPEPGKVSRRLSDKDLLRDPEEGSSGRKVPMISEQQKQKPTEKISHPSSSFKKTASFSGSRRTEPEKPVAVPLLRPPTPPVSRKPSTGPTDTQKLGPIQTKPGPTQTRPSDPREIKADLWEKAEMAKIKERFQKVNETISYWESKKREKAMRKFEESQAVVEKRRKRERGRKKFEEDMEFIKQIAGEARAKADEKRRNDILKANQKADIIRQTGDLPVTCFCC